MILTKRNIEKLIEQKKICPCCYNADCKNYDECCEFKSMEENESFSYTQR